MHYLNVKKRNRKPFGGASFLRTIYSADRTGHVLLHTLFEQASAKDIIDFYNEVFILDLVHDGKEFLLQA